MTIRHHGHVMKHERHFRNIDKLLFRLWLDRFGRQEGYYLIVYLIHHMLNRALPATFGVKTGPIHPPDSTICAPNQPGSFLFQANAPDRLRRAGFPNLFDSDSLHLLRALKENFDSGARSVLLFGALLDVLVRNQLIEARTSGRGHSLLVVVSTRRKLPRLADVQRSVFLPQRVRG